ncbi:hypothetical protein [Jiulongibacter sp. NS-SX5]|uniref:hypothetical protein n=1 Tax=Jiulongibacter sp. NS-SX5 TaxID=3463854 RepID=UPI00405A0DBA
MLKNGFVLLLLLTSLGLEAQQTNFNFSVAARNAVSPSIMVEKIYGKGHFQFGFGLRATGFFSGQNEYLTAPAKLTSGKQSIVAFFTEYNPEKIDTFSVDQTSVLALNSVITLQYKFKKSEVGFNIDAFGFTVGKAQNGTFSAVESTEFHQTEQELKPTAGNLLLISDSDIGSLNSELYFRKWLGEKTAIKVAAGFQFIEYKASQKLTYDNDRFRLKTLMPSIGFSRKL